MSSIFSMFTYCRPSLGVPRTTRKITITIACINFTQDPPIIIFWTLLVSDVKITDLNNRCMVAKQTCHCHG